MADDSCPVAGCAYSHAPGKLMCYAHWRRVPSGLQTEVYRTWRAWNGDLGNGDKMRAYAHAADAAIASVSEGKTSARFSDELAAYDDSLGL